VKAETVLTPTTKEMIRAVTILMLRLALIILVVGGGWLIYRRLPASSGKSIKSERGTTALQIVLRQTGAAVQSLDVSVSFYPVDIVAVQHEFFTEPRQGKRLEDFFKERMKGRAPVITQLDKQGHGSANLTPGSWWLHAKLTGEEDLEWRLPVSINGSRQVVELTPLNAYTRSKSF
jgi:hypothetical protein